MSPIPAEYKLIFEVFRLGLISQLISKTEVISWADQIVLSQNEPYYAVVELAMSSSVVEVISHLGNNETDSKSLIPKRVILGLLYAAYQKNLYTKRQVCQLKNKLDYSILTFYEVLSLHHMENYSCSKDDIIKLDIDISFLRHYGIFNLNNWRCWEEYNSIIEKNMRGLEQHKFRIQG